VPPNNVRRTAEGEKVAGGAEDCQLHVMCDGRPSVVCFLYQWSAVSCFVGITRVTENLIETTDDGQPTTAKQIYAESLFRQQCDDAG
jgi:hypothetical protein